MYETVYLFHVFLHPDVSTPIFVVQTTSVISPIAVSYSITASRSVRIGTGGRMFQCVYRLYFHSYVYSGLRYVDLFAVLPT